MPPVEDRDGDEVVWNLTMSDTEQEFLKWTLADRRFSTVGSDVLEKHVGEYAISI